jgi:hypothetical protein
MSRIALVLAPGAVAEANGEVEALAGEIDPIVVGLYAQVDERMRDALAFDDAVSLRNAEKESAAKRVSLAQQERLIPLRKSADLRRETKNIIKQKL